MFENRKIKGIHISRYMVSWINAGGLRFDHYFREWLSTLRINDERLTEADIREIAYFAKNGKLELECSARAFFNSKGL